MRNVVGSRYFYYTESPARALDCAWSDAVSPADRTAGGLDWPGDWPRATYRIAQDPDGDMGLVLGVPSFLPGVPDDYFDVCSESGVFYMLPQELPDDAMLWVRYIVCESAGVPVSSEELEVPLHPVLETWEAGKRVRYLLTLTIPPRGLVNPISVQVTDWTPSNNDHTPQPLLPHD